MNELIKKYAKILRNAKVGDFTYEGILYHFAKEIEQQKNKSDEVNEHYGWGK